MSSSAEPMVQVGWRSKTTGEMCDCPTYEASPHANSEPVMVPRSVFDRVQAMTHTEHGRTS